MGTFAPGRVVGLPQTTLGMLHQGLGLALCPQATVISIIILISVFNNSNLPYQQFFDLIIDKPYVTCCSLAQCAVVLKFDLLRLKKVAAFPRRAVPERTAHIY